MVSRALIGGVLCLTSASCWSLSLGQFTGQATLGKGLDIRIPMKLASQENASELCPLVKVFFAEDLVPSGQVKVSVQPGSDEATADLRVSTLSPINEPYARIDVVVGCTNQFSRRYTILADLPLLEDPKPPKGATASVDVIGGLAGVPPLANTVGANRLAGQGSTGISIKSDSNKAENSVKKVRTPAAPDLTKRAAQPRYESTVPQGPRLKLDPVELVTSVALLNPSLRLEGGFLPGFDAAASPELQDRRNAARALWLAMNETPEQVVTFAAKTGAVSAETQSLKAQLAASKQAEIDLQASLEAEREAIYTHPLVLSLLGGLVLAFGGLAIFLRRKLPLTDEKQPWWKRSGDKQASEVGVDQQPSALKSAMRKLVARTKPSIDIDVDTLFPPDKDVTETDKRLALIRESKTQAPSTISGPEFLPSTLLDGSRSVATEELFDLQQQVEFFVSLGQSEQAVEVLVNHLSDSQEPSPLAYLDLLRLYHDLDRRTDYETLRKDFNRLFSGNAPAFDDYSYSRRGLERYESTLRRIQQLWPEPAVLDVIERSIFRQSTNQDDEVFDLEAYRELLLLYSIARELIAPGNPLGGSSEGPSSLFGYLDEEAPTRDSGMADLHSPVVQNRETFRRGNSFLASSTAGLAGAADFGSVDAHTSSPSLDLDLSLDVELPAAGSATADNIPPLPSAVTTGEQTPGGMSFDLSDSMFDSPSALSTMVPTTSLKADSPSTSGDFRAEASLDFSGLDDIDGLTIKKSGVQS